MLKKWAHVASPAFGVKKCRVKKVKKCQILAGGAESVAPEVECDGDGRPVFAYGDARRGAAAWIVWHRSGAPQAWIAERLGLRSAANVSQQRRKFDTAPDVDLVPDLRRWRRSWRKLGIFD